MIKILKSYIYDKTWQLDIFVCSFDFACSFISENRPPNIGPRKMKKWKNENTQENLTLSYGIWSSEYNQILATSKNMIKRDR